MPKNPSGSPPLTAKQIAEYKRIHDLLDKEEDLRGYAAPPPPQKSVWERLGTFFSCCKGTEEDERPDPHQLGYRSLPGGPSKK